MSAEWERYNAKRKAEIEEYWKQITWRKIAHNHSGILGHDTCPLCVIENALWGYKKEK